MTLRLLSVFVVTLLSENCTTMKKICLILLLIGTNCCLAQNSSGEQAIRDIVAKQAKCWNNGDLECFMDSYWKSDQLMFIGSRGITYGWNNVLQNYKASYPDKDALGILSLEIRDLKPLSADTYFCVGSWHLKRPAGDLQGYFTLLWKKIEGEWVIVSDHSS